MVRGTVRLFGGDRPSARLVPNLERKETCFARFADDPEGRLWVCARVGREVFGTVLAPDEEWLRPGGGALFLDARPTQPTRRVAKKAA